SMHRRWLLLPLLALPLVGADAPPDVSKLPAPAAGRIDFNRDIKPILQAHCVECHGPNKQKGGLRLDASEPALRGSDSGEIIGPEKSAESAFIRLVGGLDPKRKRPPKGTPPTSAEIAKLRAWIDQGAKWPKDAVLAEGAKHWSFQPVKRPTPPPVQN